MPRFTVTVHTDAEIGTIEPALHGHFAEHLGRCIYGGIWHADDGDDRYREDTVSLLDELDIPVLRWPGGCFADDYHWRDGIGPTAERPRRRNLFWGQGPEMSREESNAFGTDEFLQLCERIGAEPYLAVNVGSGSPGEAVDWVEYCNYHGDTTLANVRRENGHDEPYGVRYWGLGNENWGCGGRMSPEQYAREYRRYSTYVGAMDNLGGDEEIELIACGFSRHEWNRRFLEEVKESSTGPEFPLDHLTLHHYYGQTLSVEDAPPEDLEGFLADALEIRRHIERIAGAIDAVATTRDIEVIIDEWGAWHPEAKPEEGLEQPGTVIDALSAAAVLNVFNNHSDVLAMTNIAQTVNVLQCLVETDADRAWKRPTYHVFDLFSSHRANTAVRSSIDTPVRSVSDGRELPMLSASSSISDDGTVCITLASLDCRERHPIEIVVEGRAVDQVDADILFSDAAPTEAVDAENASSFEAKPLTPEVDGETLHVELPPASVCAVRIS